MDVLGLAEVIIKPIAGPVETLGMIFDLIFSNDEVKQVKRNINAGREGFAEGLLIAKEEIPNQVKHVHERTIHAGLGKKWGKSETDNL